jgi:hypothetical protein
LAYSNIGWPTRQRLLARSQREVASRAVAPYPDWFSYQCPEHNPIEHVWLNGKTQIRKQAGLKTFAQVKQCFVDTITANTYNYEKFNSYFP